MKKKLVAALLCGAMAAGSITVYAETVHAEGDTTITVMASQDWVYDAEMELGKKFEEETGIKIDYQIVPADQYYNMLMTKLNSGEGPDIFGGQAGAFDIVSQYNVEENAVDLSDQPWVETYDEFANDDERAFLEYFLRDVYETYGYDFHYYKGEPVDEEWVTKKISRFTTLNRFISRSWESLYRNTHNQKTGAPLDQEEIERRIQDTLSGLDSNRLHVSKLLMRGLRFINEDGQPLKMMTPLKLDPALLEQPLYH